MDTFERWFTQDLNKPILPQHGQGLVFTGDDGTPLVGVHVTRNGAPADLSGTVSCAVIRADGTTVPVTGGTISGGDVSVVLSSACFNIRGPIGVALAITSGSTTMTVLKAMFQVDITSTGNIIDPSGEITLDVANLIADIDAAVASIPADYSDLLAAIAPTFIASKAYAAGAYVWYNGNLYRFTAAHAAGAWTGTDAAQVPLAGDVADLKSAIDNLNVPSPLATTWSQGKIDPTTGNTSSNATRVRSDWIPIDTHGVKIVLQNGTKACVFYYNSDRSYIGYDDYVTGTIVKFAPLSDIIRIVIARTDDADITPTDITSDTEVFLLYPTDTTLSQPYKSADAKVTGDKIRAISGSNRNLWTGNASYTFTSYTDIAIDPPLPAGTYTMSCVITSDDTAASYSRAQISTGQTLDFSRDTRQSASVTATSAITSIRLFASRNTSTSGGKTATWADIQIEAGAVATPYILHAISAVDEVARFKLDKLVKYVSTSGSDENDGNAPTSAYASIEKALSETADVIYIAKGTYTENFESGSEHTNYRHRGLTIIANNATLITNRTLHFRLTNRVDIRGLNVEIVNPITNAVSGIYLYDCTGVLSDCSASGAPNMGIRLDGSKVTLNRCVAHDNGIDGFNGHNYDTGYSCECTFNACKAYNNGDDGLSIHEAGKMYVHGGEYYNNVQAGLAPHNKCEFEAYGVHSHHNGKGIEAVEDTLSEGDTPASGRIIGCILNDNTTYGLDVKYYTVNTLTNGYANNGTAPTRTQTGGTINNFSVS